MVIAVALLATLAVTPGVSGEFREPRQGRSTRAGGRAGAVPPTYLTFADPTGAGLPAISHHRTALCDALAAEVPDWSTPVEGGAGNWCLGGDGLSVTGSEVTFATFGTPSTIGTPVCPSGLDCLAATGQPVKALQTGTGQGSAASAAVASGTGAMTACWWGRAHDATQQWLLSNMSADSIAGHGYRIEYLAAGTLRTVMSTGAALVISTPAGPSAGEGAYVCLSHPGGSGTMKTYLNGGTPTVTTAFTRNSTSAKPTLHGFNGATAGTGAGSMDSFGAFYVDQELSAAQIAAISRRVLADQPKAIIRGKTELAMTYSRTGTRFCSRSDNTGSLIPANRPCIARGGLLSEAAATNLILRSQEFDNAAWDKVASGDGVVPTVTANYALAPDGTKTADRVVFSATTTPYTSAIRPLTVVGIGARKQSSQVFLRGTSTSGEVQSCQRNSTSTGYVCVTCAYAPDAWSRCLNEDVLSARDLDFWIGNFGGTYSAQDVLIWGAQVETGSVATSYIPTTSAAASRGADNASVTHPSIAVGSMSARANVAANAANSRIVSSYALPATDANRWDLFVNGTTLTNFLSVNSVTESLTTTVTSPFDAGVAVWRKPATSLNTQLNNGFQSQASTLGSFDSTTLYIGKYGTATGYEPNGFVSDVCLDSRPTRCR